MAEQSVIGTYDSMDEADAAVRKLVEGGFPATQVSVLAQNLQSQKQVHGFITTGDVAKVGAGTGAWVGGLFGLLTGVALVFVPAVGPLLVAGPFAASLLGGIEGAIAGAGAGGLLGALAGVGVSKQHIVKYEDQLKAGKYLLLAQGSAADVARAQSILQTTAPAELTAHSAAPA
ncbi:MAG TPA: general stress protein [Chloroflexota bacterium]|nr:general stress protein [Chloroflexota bacterium]